MTGLDPRGDLIRAALEQNADRVDVPEEHLLLAHPLSGRRHGDHVPR